MDIDFQEENDETVEDYIKDIIHDHNYVRESYTLQYLPQMNIEFN